MSAYIRRISVKTTPNPARYARPTAQPPATNTNGREKTPAPMIVPESKLTGSTKRRTNAMWILVRQRRLGRELLHDPFLQKPENRKYEKHQNGGKHRHRVEPEPDRHADRGRHPDAGSRRDALELGLVEDDHAGADETDAGDDLRRNAARVIVDNPRNVVPVHEVGGNDRENRGAERNQRVGAKTCCFSGQFPLKADRGTQKNREAELQREFSRQRIHGRLPAPCPRPSCRLPCPSGRHRSACGHTPGTKPSAKTRSSPPRNGRACRS